MASAVSSALSPLTSAFASAGTKTATTGGFGTIGWIVAICLFVGLALVSVVGAFIWFHYSEKKKWAIKTRVHYENPTINGVIIGDPVLTKRVRFKDGRVVYMYKTPIQGYTISPELLTWTRPREHDVVITQDKKLFCVIGFNSIDVQRKKLNVDISYPDIEMDRQDLQTFVDSKKFDDPNERFKIIAKAAMWIFIMITVIVVVILGTRAWIDAKNVDAGRDQTNLQTARYQAATMQEVNTFILILSKVMPQSFQAINGQNLLGQLNITSITP